MILDDGTIAFYVSIGKIGVNPPPSDRAIQPASLEVHLSFEDWQKCGYLDGGEVLRLNDEDVLLLRPNEFRLAHTVETVTLPDDLCAQVNGKSSLGRLGLLVHATAGFVDPGFSGQLTLELKNLSSRPLTLHRGQPIAQLVFHRLEKAARRPYGHEQLGSHYQGQMGTTLSYMDL